MFAIINWHDFSKETPEDVFGEEAFCIVYMLSTKDYYGVEFHYYNAERWKQAEVEYWALMPEKPRKPDESVWLGMNEPLKENANYVE